MEIEIPEGIEIKEGQGEIEVSGPKGKTGKKFPLPIKIEGKKIIIPETNKELTNTTVALIKSAFKGVTEGYKRKMQIIYSHFPISIEVKERKVFIKNFLGEKIPRTAEIIGDTKVEVEKEKITISGADAYSVGQTVANIRATTKIKAKDPRVFQDGIYQVEE